MARRKLEDRNIRKLLKNSGGSIQVTLPIDSVRELGWRDKQKVVIKKSGNKLIIEDWKK
jgi:antitoxin component of MazEF toxin-antitoxin module